MTKTTRAAGSLPVDREERRGRADPRPYSSARLREASSSDSRDSIVDLSLTPTTNKWTIDSYFSHRKRLSLSLVVVGGPPIRPQLPPCVLVWSF